MSSLLAATQRLESRYGLFLSEDGVKKLFDDTSGKLPNDETLFQKAITLNLRAIGRPFLAEKLRPFRGSTGCVRIEGPFVLQVVSCRDLHKPSTSKLSESASSQSRLLGITLTDGGGSNSSSTEDKDDKEDGNGATSSSSGSKRGAGGGVSSTKILALEMVHIPALSVALAVPGAKMLLNYLIFQPTPSDSLYLSPSAFASLCGGVSSLASAYNMKLLSDASGRRKAADLAKGELAPPKWQSVLTTRNQKREPAPNPFLSSQPSSSSSSFSSSSVVVSAAAQTQQIKQEQRRAFQPIPVSSGSTNNSNNSNSNTSSNSSNISSSSSSNTSSSTRLTPLTVISATPDHSFRPTVSLASLSQASSSSSSSTFAAATAALQVTGKEEKKGKLKNRVQIAFEPEAASEQSKSQLSRAPARSTGIATMSTPHPTTTTTTDTTDTTATTATNATATTTSAAASAGGGGGGSGTEERGEICREEKKPEKKENVHQPLLVSKGEGSVVSNKASRGRGGETSTPHSFAPGLQYVDLQAVLAASPSSASSSTASSTSSSSSTGGLILLQHVAITAQVGEVILLDRRGSKEQQREKRQRQHNQRQRQRQKQGDATAVAPIAYGEPEFCLQFFLFRSPSSSSPPPSSSVSCSISTGGIQAVVASASAPLLRYLVGVGLEDHDGYEHQGEGDENTKKNEEEEEERKLQRLARKLIEVQRCFSGQEVRVDLLELQQKNEEESNTNDNNNNSTKGSSRRKNKNNNNNSSSNISSVFVLERIAVLPLPQNNIDFL